MSSIVRRAGCIGNGRLGGSARGVQQGGHALRRASRSAPTGPRVSSCGIQRSPSRRKERVGIGAVCRPRACCQADERPRHNDRSEEIHPWDCSTDALAIVTGAGRGIGREEALLLAKHGAKVS
jgi:hypothetical protein